MNPPLAVVRYLAELDSALAARNAPDRDQIVTQIGEHIAQALGPLPDPPEADVAGVLRELGDPLRIAEEAAPGSPEGPAGAAGPRPAPMPAWTAGTTSPPPKPPLLMRSWVPAVAVGLWVIGAAAALAPLLLVASSPVGGLPDGFILASVVLNIPLVASIVLVFVSPLFRPPGRWVWLLSVPAVVLIESIAGRSGVQHSYYPIDAAIVWAIMIASPVAAAWAVVLIAVRAYRRATAGAPDASRPGFGSISAATP